MAGMLSSASLSMSIGVDILDLEKEQKIKNFTHSHLSSFTSSLISPLLTQPYSHNSWSNRGKRFIMGLSKGFPFIRMVADLTMPSSDLFSASMVAIFQCPFSVPSSITRTTSPIFGSGNILYHLVRGEISGSISRMNWFHTPLSIRWTSRNLAPSLECSCSWSQGYHVSCVVSYQKRIWG